jgi:hypothetical protein
MGNEAEHLNFFDKIVHTLVDMRESVDLPACEMGCGRHQVFIFRAESEFISEGGGVDVRTKTRMLCNILNTFPIVIDDVMKVFEALDIVIFCHYSFHLILLEPFIIPPDLPSCLPAGR